MHALYTVDRNTKKVKEKYRFWLNPELKHQSGDIELKAIKPEMFDIDLVYDLLKPRMSLMKFGLQAFMYGDGTLISYSELEQILNYDNTYPWLILKINNKFYLRKKEYEQAEAKK